MTNKRKFQTLPRRKIDCDISDNDEETTQENRWSETLPILKFEDHISFD